MAPLDKSRVDLLVELIRKNGVESEEIFDALVPKFYAELYCLYNILDKTGVLDECKFKNPSLLNNNAQFPIMITTKLRKKVLEYLESKKFIVKYLKTDEFTVIINKTDYGVSIYFNRV
jgi:hypothetical protein